MAATVHVSPLIHVIALLATLVLHANSPSVSDTTHLIRKLAQEMAPVFPQIHALAVPIGMDPIAKTHRVSVNWSTTLLSVVHMALVWLPITAIALLATLVLHANSILVSVTTHLTRKDVH